MKNLYKLEQKKLREIAKKYQDDGYEVVVTPDKMPVFLKGYQADMVALSADDKVIIEVVSKDSIRNREKLERIAKLVNKRKKWRFEIVVTNPKTQDKEDIEHHEILKRLSQARHLLESNQENAAILLAWSAVEALMRILALNSGIKKLHQSPIQLTKTLYSVGEIGKSSYETLILAAKHRNHVAHGYMSESITRDISTLTDGLINVSSDLIKKIFQKENLPDEEYTVDDLVSWFFEHYEDPANGVPHDSGEGGYQYICGGPYDPWEELADEFPDVNEKLIENAAQEIYSQGFDWVKKGQY